MTLDELRALKRGDVIGMGYSAEPRLGLVLYELHGGGFDVLWESPLQVTEVHDEDASMLHLVSKRLPDAPPTTRVCPICLGRNVPPVRVCRRCRGTGRVPVEGAPR